MIGAALRCILSTINRNVFDSSWRVDLDNASYDSSSFDTSSKETLLQAFFIGDSGNKLYFIGSNSDAVHEYTLSTAWDLTTATFNFSFSVGSQESSPRGMFISPDGTRVFIVGSSSDKVYSYTLSTAWSLSTASYDSVLFDVSSEEAVSQDLIFNPLGEKLFIIGSVSDSVHQYSLTEPYDISTAVYDDISFSFATQESTPNGLFINPDGNKLYIVGSGSSKVFEYDIAVPWDLSDVTYNGKNFSIASQQSTATGVFFDHTGDKFYISGTSTPKIDQFSAS